MWSKKCVMAVWLCLVLNGTGCTDETEPKKSEPVAAIPEAVIAAWKKQGATFGWFGTTKPHYQAFSADRAELIDPVPAFRFSPKASDADLKQLPPIDQPFALILAGTPITDEGLKELKEMKQLISLNLAQTKVTDVGLKELKGLTQLTDLALSRTNVTDAGLKELKGLGLLTELGLSHTKVSDAGLKVLGEFKQLKILYIAETKVTDAGLRELQESLPKCEILK